MIRLKNILKDIIAIVVFTVLEKLLSLYMFINNKTKKLIKKG